MTRLTGYARLLSALAVLTCVTAAGTMVAAADDKPAAAAADGKDREAAALAARLDRNLPEVNFKDIGFTDAVDFLRDVSGANIVVDWRGLEAAGVDRNVPVTYQAQNVKFAAALRDITRLAGGADRPVSHGAIGNVIVISTPQRIGRVKAGWQATTDRVKDDRTRVLLGKTLPEVSMDGVGLADVLDFFRDVTGAAVNAHWQDIEAAGVDKNVPVTIRLTNVPSGQALYLILAMSSTDKPLEFTAEEGRIMIRPAAAADKPVTRPATK